MTPENEITVNGQVYVLKETEQPKAEEKIVWIAIKNRFTDSIIFQSTKTTYREAVNECVEEAKTKWTRANLTNADLTDADLTRANLTDADLTRANLTDANLTDADLTDANLTYANLTDANLTDADLTDADLTRANLTDANLTACKYYMGSSNENFETLCKYIKTIKWNSNTGSDFIK